VDRCMKWLV